MILFCEECGQRNSIILKPSIIENNRFTCQFCGFHSPFPFLDKNRRRSRTGSNITWHPEVLQLGPGSEGEEQQFRLVFTVADIQTPELTVAPFQRFSHLITVHKAEPGTFMIIIRPPGTDEALPPGYSGPGIIYCEEHLMSWGTIDLLREEQAETSGVPVIPTQNLPLPAAPQAGKAADELAEDREVPDEHMRSLEQQLAEYRIQLHQARTASLRMQKELAVRRQIMDSQQCGILLVNLEQRIVYANPVFLRQTGYSLKAVQGKRLEQVVSLADTDCTLREAMQQAMQEQQWEGTALLKEAVRQGNWQSSGDSGEKEGEGKQSALYIRYSEGGEEGQDKAFVCLLYPKEPQENASTMSYGRAAEGGGGDAQANQNHLSAELTYDSLTGLVDRPSFQQYLEDSIQLAQDDDARISLLYVDLDHFKRINQIFGPGFGDKILCSVATILQQCGKEAGADLVARLSGDEFAVVLPPPSDRKVAEQLAREIMQRFRTPVNNESRAILIRPSIGYSVYPDDGESPLDLLRNADTAMESAKSEGGNRVRSWNSGMKIQAAQSLYLENDLREAVANDKLINFYQPQIDLTNGAICGMEALARWIHPVKGLVSPGAFIPIAESTGLIEKMCIDLVRQACLQGKRWRDMGFRKFVMAVNLSGRLLRRRDLFYQIMSCIECTGFPPEWLEIEFTEGVLIENMDFTVDLVGKLRAEGIKLAIDDFGTGYSSLSYLQHLHVDKIKIDRSFITNVTTNRTDAAITLGIVAIAKNLRFRVIAEGIETEEHLFFLQKNGCNEGQGFLFSPPIPEKEMTGLLLRDSSVALNHKRMIDKFYSIRA
ncbi:MAG: EAL domain-containing protein [Candidatus Electrothrix sp. YB6]